MRIFSFILQLYRIDQSHPIDQKLQQFLEPSTSESNEMSLNAY